MTSIISKQHLQHLVETKNLSPVEEKNTPLSKKSINFQNNSHELFNFALNKEDINKPFDKNRFSWKRYPVNIGEVKMEFSQNLPSCLDMPIFLPGNEEIILPEAYANEYAIVSFILQSLLFEDRLLPDWKDTHYVYLTVDQRELIAGKTHRNGGWHIDGMQGYRYHPKLLACHQYIVSDKNPTEFSVKALNAEHLNELKDNWFEMLGAQVYEKDEIVQPQPYDIMMMSAYQLHRSPVSRPEHTGKRTFIRMDITQKKFDRLGNTINPLLDAGFDYQPRPLPFDIAQSSNASWNNSEKYNNKK